MSPSTPSRASSWLAPAPPSVAIEIASRRITVVGLSANGAAIVSQAVEPLEAGAVMPALTGVNIPQPAIVADALRRALDRAGLRSTRRVALVIPDSASRVSMLALEQVPAKASDLSQLIRLQLRKAMPFPIDDAVISHFEASRDTTAITIAAMAARRDVIAQYEAVVASAGIHAGIVDLASFNVMNAVIAAGTAPAADWLLVHLASEATSLAILRGPQLLFYRHRTAIDDEPLSALVHQTAMYHEDRLGGGPFARVLISGAGTGADDITHEIGVRLGAAVETVDVRPAVELRDRLTVSSDLLDAIAAPVGVLVRDRRAA